MGELLLELLSEEIPARMQRRAIDGLTGLVRDKLAAANISATSLMGYVTPRRLVVIADGIPVSGAAVDIDDLTPPPSHDGLTPIITYQSDPLSVLATTMMKLSQNQYAEALLRTVGGGTVEGGRAAVTQQ